MALTRHCFLRLVIALRAEKESLEACGACPRPFVAFAAKKQRREEIDGDAAEKEIRHNLRERHSFAAEIVN